MTLVTDVCDCEEVCLIYLWLSPEDAVDAALTEAVSTLGLARLTQNQAADLTAVFGLWSFYKVISESTVNGQEACRYT